MYKTFSAVIFHSNGCTHDVKIIAKTNNEAEVILERTVKKWGNITGTYLQYVD